MGVTSLHPPGIGSVLARLVVVVGTIVAFQVSVAKPNPPPSAHNRKKVTIIEKISFRFFQPFMLCVPLVPCIVEFVAISMRLAAPPTYDVVSGTCAERISFNAFGLVGFILSVCGMVVRLWCYQALGRLFTFELALLPGHKLITTGPYSFVRHPSYMAFFLASVGVTMVMVCEGSWTYECSSNWMVSAWGVGWGAGLLLTTFNMVVRCELEDQFLQEAFMVEWNAWRKQVKWRMVPFIY